MKMRLFAAWLCGATLVVTVAAQNTETQRQIEKATTETLPAAVRLIEHNTDAKVALEVDAASFGDDAKAWGNLYIVVHRIVSTLGEIGRDQAGKDAIDKSIKRIIIVKTGAEAKEDSIELKDGVLTVKTSASDHAVTVLQGVITSGLEKAL